MIQRLQLSFLGLFGLVGFFGFLSCYSFLMILSLVVAADEHNVIGGGNTLLWKLPNDFKRMKELTMGKPLIMGRKTHESIGRVLPGRTNIVISRDASKVMKDAVAVGSLQEGIERAESEGGEEAIIFGGGEIYRMALPFAKRIYLTRVHGHFEGDTTFPEIGEEWRLTKTERHEKDKDHECAFTFETYERK